MKYRNRIPDSVTIVNTQTETPKVKMPKTLSRAHSFGAILASDGFGVQFNYGIIKNNEGSKTEIDRFYNLLYFQLEVGERYHPKEKRIFPNSGNNPPSSTLFLAGLSRDMIKFGKINNFYMTKIGVGYKYLIAGHAEPSSYSIHWNTNAGLSLALLKPYYFLSDGGYYLIDPEQQNLANELSRIRFTGAEGFRKGWNELKVNPGFYVRSGLVFDFAQKRKVVSGLAVGLVAEVYSQKIYQMAFQNPKPFFFNAYIGLELGWKK
ncbi:MAG TPA: hypothetical protein PKX92_11255 [Edaphocola sp.]|nr:hypothetical protein [Edaphocola sp.]